MKMKHNWKKIKLPKTDETSCIAICKIKIWIWNILNLFSIRELIRLQAISAKLILRQWKRPSLVFISSFQKYDIFADVMEAELIGSTAIHTSVTLQTTHKFRDWRESWHLKCVFVFSLEYNLPNSFSEYSQKYLFRRCSRKGSPFLIWAKKKPISPRKLP